MIKIRGKELTKESFAKMVDLAIVNPYTTEQEILKAIEDCKKYRFNVFCVNLSRLPLVARELEGTGVDPTVVLDFPFGAGSDESRIAEAESAVKLGAKGVDPLINIGALKDKDYKLATRQLKDIKKAVGDRTVKVIIEAPYLTKEEMAAACSCIADAGCDYVKTASGRCGRGPQPWEIAWMKETLKGTGVKIKCSGILPFWPTETAIGALCAGADIIGTRQAAALVDDLPRVEALFRNMEITGEAPAVDYSIYDSKYLQEGESY